MTFFFKKLDSVGKGGNKQARIEGGALTLAAFALRGMPTYAWKSKKTGSLKIHKEIPTINTSGNFTQKKYEFPLLSITLEEHLGAVAFWRLPSSFQPRCW